MTRKIRSIDYNREELQRLIGIKEDAFYSHFNRVIERFKFNSTDFRVDHDENSDYYYPIEIVDLLALLIETEKKYPLFRTNSKIEKLTGTKMLEYIKSLDNGIGELPEIFYDMISILPAYEQTLKIRDYTNELIEQLTVLIVNITKSENNHIGSVIEWLTQKLIQVNYMLFENDNIHKNIDTSNRKYEKELKKELGIVEDDTNIELENLLDILESPGLPLEHVIATLIKRLLHDTKHLNSSEKNISTFDYSKWKDFDTTILGINLIEKESTNPDENVFLERILYTESLSGYVNDCQRNQAKTIITAHENNLEKFKKKKKAMLEGKNIFRQGLSVEERKRMIQINIESLQKQLTELEDLELNEIEEHNSYFDTLAQKYAEFYNEALSKEKESIGKTVDSFVGRTIINLNHFNIPKD